MLSSYLLEHPMLSPTDVRVLGLLLRHTRESHRMRDGEEVASRATREDLLASAGVSHPSVKRSLSRLEQLGLIRIDKIQKKHVYTLLPGPWPMLGDRPERGLTWRELRTYNGPSIDVPVWEEVSRQGVTMEVIMGFLDQSRKRQVESEEADRGLLDTPKTRKATRQPAVRTAARQAKTLDAVSDSGFSTNPDSERIFHNDTPQHSERIFHYQALDSERIFHYHGLKSYTVTNHSERFFHYLGRKNRVNDVPDDVSAIGTPICSTIGFSQLQMKTANAPAAWRRLSRYRSAWRSRHAEPHQAEPPPAIERALAGAEVGAREKKHKQSRNFAGEAQTRYRDLLRERFDADFGRFTAGQSAQIRQSVSRNGGERVLALITWVFDNWATLKRQNPGLYGSDRVPPLKSFTSANLVDAYLPFVDAGDPLDAVDADRNPWQHVAFGAGRKESELDFNDELDKLL